MGALTLTARRVFEARDTMLGRHVALKFLRAQGVDSDILLRGVLRECRVLAELKITLNRREQFALVFRSHLCRNGGAQRLFE